MKKSPDQGPADAFGTRIESKLRRYRARRPASLTATPGSRPLPHVFPGQTQRRVLEGVRFSARSLPASRLERSPRETCCGPRRRPLHRLAKFGPADTVHWDGRSPVTRWRWDDTRYRTTAPFSGACFGEVPRRRSKIGTVRLPVDVSGVSRERCRALWPVNQAAHNRLDWTRCPFGQRIARDIEANVAAGYSPRRQRTEGMI